MHRAIGPGGVVSFHEHMLQLQDTRKTELDGMIAQLFKHQKLQMLLKDFIERGNTIIRETNKLKTCDQPVRSPDAESKRKKKRKPQSIAPRLWMSEIAGVRPQP